MSEMERNEAGRKEKREDDEAEDSSMRLRKAMMKSMSASWNRSTMSAHVSWKRFSFSNFLKTLPLISTNWFERRSVRSAFEYELMATLRVTS